MRVRRMGENAETIRFLNNFFLVSQGLLATTVPP